jgi:hypothetical protein
MRKLLSTNINRQVNTMSVIINHNGKYPLAGTVILNQKLTLMLVCGRYSNRKRRHSASKEAVFQRQVMV